MPNLKDIRTRIASVKNTQKITSAMKMVSAAKLRRAQERAEQARPYALKMDLVISSVAGRVQDATHPLLQVNELPSKALVIVVTSNRGLCAGFNANVFRTMARFLREQAAAGVEVHLATVGRKGDVFYRTRDTKVARNYTDVIGNISYAKAKKIAQDAIENFVMGEYDRVYIIYNEFVSAIAYNTNIHQLLPLSLDDLAAAPAVAPPAAAAAAAGLDVPRSSSRQRKSSARHAQLASPYSFASQGARGARGAHRNMRLHGSGSKRLATAPRWSCAHRVCTRCVVAMCPQ